MTIAALTMLGGCLESENSAGLSGKPGGSTNRAPSISGTPAPSVLMGVEYSFTPTASDPDNDPLTFSIQGRPAWASFDTQTGEMSGTPTLGDIGTYAGIVLSVSDGNDSSSLPQFSVDVVQNADGTITLSWTAPTQNEDGSALLDLAAYKIYYGTSPGSYFSQVRINNAGVTSYVLQNLTPATYYIVATAINSGGTESIFSNEVSKQVL